MTVEVSKASINFVTEFVGVTISKATINFVTGADTIDISKVSVNFIVDNSAFGPDYGGGGRRRNFMGYLP